MSTTFLVLATGYDPVLLSPQLSVLPLSLHQANGGSGMNRTFSPRFATSGPDPPAEPLLTYSLLTYAVVAAENIAFLVA